MKFRSDRGSVGALLLWGVVALFFFVILPFFVFGKIVPPDQIGLRQNYYSVPGLLKKGFEEHGLLPGLQWKIPFVSNVLLFPRTFQLVQLNEDTETGSLDLPALEVPTTDGSKVKTDVTLVLRLYESPGENLEGGTKSATPKEDEKAKVPLPTKSGYPHGALSELVKSYSTNSDQQLATFASIAQNELRKALSGLSSTDYYNTALRERAALRAHDQINKDVAPAGIELWASLIRRYVYVERNIDDQIFAKNLQDQAERLNAASSRLAEAQAETEQQLALWDAKIRDLQVEGEAKVGVLRSEGSLYEATKTAQGDLLVSTARAEVDSAKARALTEIAGADVYVAREMTPLLKTLKGGVVGNIDPYNINDWVRKMVGRKQQ